MLRTHYRSPFNFSDANLDDARASLRRLYTALDGLDVPTRDVDWATPQAAAFRAAMNDDFNTPLAVAVLFELAAEVNRGRSTDAAASLKGLAATLGFLQQVPRSYLQAGNTLDETRIAERIEARNAAKKARDFALADSIRDELLAQGVVLQDSAGGTSWVKA
jgi:cysteinyl-tRNA synthetase